MLTDITKSTLESLIAFKECRHLQTAGSQFITESSAGISLCYCGICLTGMAKGPPKLDWPVLKGDYILYIFSKSQHPQGSVWVSPDDQALGQFALAVQVGLEARQVAGLELGEGVEHDAGHKVLHKRVHNLSSRESLSCVRRQRQSHNPRRFLH